MYEHSRNQNGIMLASKALEEQGSRLVSANCSKEKKNNRGRNTAASLYLFFPCEQHNLERTKIRVSLIPVVNG